jgi:hypothetical protein
MTCGSFERWLDQGMPQPITEGMREHARSCQRCARKYASATELHLALDTAFGRSGESPSAFISSFPPITLREDQFTERVMSRIEGVEKARSSVATMPLLVPVAWWIRAAAEPASALAMVVAGLLAWQRDALLSAGRVAVSRVSEIAVTRLDSWSVPPWIDPAAVSGLEVQIGLAAAFLPLLFMACNALFRWSERTVRVPTRAHVGR